MMRMIKRERRATVAGERERERDGGNEEAKAVAAVDGETGNQRLSETGERQESEAFSPVINLLCSLSLFLSPVWVSVLSVRRFCLTVFPSARICCREDGSRILIARRKTEETWVDCSCNTWEGIGCTAVVPVEPF